MLPSAPGCILALHLVVSHGVLAADFESLGGGYCSGTSGSRVASLLQGASGGFKQRESLQKCEAQCAKDTSCDGFEFEDDGRGCRLLKGTITKASGDYGPYPRMNCYVNSRKVNAAKAKAQSDKMKSGYDVLAPICNMYICPAGQKRVPKQSFVPWTYGCSNGADEGKALHDCCVAQDVCFRTCGMSSKYCFSTFAQCSIKICGSDRSPANPCINRTVQTTFEIGKTIEDRCTYYEDAQAEACECTAETEFRASFEQWVAGFYAKHQPDKLDDSKKLLNSEQIWKKWSNKEPELLLALFKKYKGAVEHRETDEKEVLYLAAQRKSAVADEDYMAAKRIKRREALLATKMEAMSSSSTSKLNNEMAEDGKAEDDGAPGGATTMQAEEGYENDAKAEL